MKRVTTAEKNQTAKSNQIGEIDNTPGELLISGSLGWTLHSQTDERATKKEKCKHRNPITTILA